MNKSLCDVAGLVSGLRLGHRWWCRIGECAATRTSVVVQDWVGAAVHFQIQHQQDFLSPKKTQENIFLVSCFFVYYVIVVF